LLLQVAFHARMAQEQGAFDFGDVVQAITEKAIAATSACFRRGPRVDARTMSNCSGIGSRAKRKPARTPTSKPSNLPARCQAFRSVCRPHPRPQAAAEGRQGWLRLERSDGGAREDPRGSGKTTERNRKPRSAQASARNPRQRRVTCCSRSSTSHVISMPIPRQCCCATNQKFERRFASIERALKARNKTPGESTLAEMDALWDEAKAAEK